MTDEVSDLLALAFADPSLAIERAGARLPGASDRQRVELLRVMGNACRELRRIDDSAAHLTEAVRTAVELGDGRLEGLASMSLAATLTYTGEFDRALLLGSRAIDLLDGDDRVVAMSQRAGLLDRAGRHAEALAALSEALTVASTSTDATIEGDIRMNRGVLLGQAGEIDEAEADTRRARELFESMGWDKRAADMAHNLAWLAGRRGDLVEAFRRFDEAERLYESVGMTGAAVFPDRSEALLAAGLTTEALALAERSAAVLRSRGDDVDVAEALMLVARASLLAGDAGRAAAASAEASELFAGQGRAGWMAAAAALNVEARLRAGLTDEADVARIGAVIDATAEAGLEAARADAVVAAAELAVSGGDWDAARLHLTATRRENLGISARCRFDLANVGLLASTGGAPEALAACTAAVDEFAVLAATLGGIEVRAHVALHVAGLVERGLSLALAGGDPALVFAWGERQRASALAVAPVRPPEDADAARELDLLRAALTELDARTRIGVVDDDLARTCAALQDRVRRRARHTAGDTGRPGTGALGGIVVADGAAWVSYIVAGGQLSAVTVVDGKAALVPLGSVAAASREASLLSASLSMHLNAVGRGATRRPASAGQRLDRDTSTLMASAAAADELLLAPLGLPDGPVALSPIAGLHELPWGLLPSLRARSFTLAPSRAVWERCRLVDVEVVERVVAIAGPGVPLGDQEATRVASWYPAALVVTGGAATVATAGSAMIGADVAHVACHGRFSVDNPMFSSLLLHDGPMFVYDLERLAPAPKVVVLSACHAGVHARPAGGEILGLTAALLARGPRAVIAATVPVPETLSTLDAMDRLHRELAAGSGPAEALRRAREIDPVVAGAFACHGAG